SRADLSIRQYDLYKNTVNLINSVGCTIRGIFYFHAEVSVFGNGIGINSDPHILSKVIVVSSFFQFFIKFLPLTQQICTVKLFSCLSWRFRPYFLLVDGLDCRIVGMVVDIAKPKRLSQCDLEIYMSFLF